MEGEHVNEGRNEGVDGAIVGFRVGLDPLGLNVGMRVGRDGAIEGE